MLGLACRRCGPARATSWTSSSRWPPRSRPNGPGWAQTGPGGRSRLGPCSAARS